MNLSKGKQLLIRAGEILERIGYVWMWVVISMLLLLLVVPMNPAKLGAYLWAMSKITGAAAIGYGFDWAAFRGRDPRYLDGIDGAMAQTRRATIIAAAMIAAGLIG